MTTSLDTFKSFSDIDVKLVGAIGAPFELAVASARTCYSGKGIVFPQDVSKDERAVQIRDKIASSTLEAGHVTTRQHAHFVFALSGVSRQFIWSFLHSHPFYNSEQVSQRYVRVKRGNFLIPPMEEKYSQLFGRAADQQMDTYEKLIALLKESIGVEYYDRFKSRRKERQKWDGVVEKRAMEVARYVLGVGTTAYLYHTVSALTLLRYAKLLDSFETPDEQRIVVRKMLDCVRSIDPLFEKEVSDPVSLDKTLEHQVLDKFNSPPNVNHEFISHFDREMNGRCSLLIDYSANAEEVLRKATSVSLGRLRLSKEQAIGMLLDPEQNRILADTLHLTPFDKLSSILHHVSFTFQKKLSHTADSQDQRHRTVPASRPLLFLHYDGKPDYVTPIGIETNDRAKELFLQSIHTSFKAVNDLIESGLKKEFAFYLLPNAYSIRMISTGDLHSLQHKWKMRSCYNAQEEIFRATVEELQQVQAVFPNIARHLKAPCYLRLKAGVTPYCPEGDRYCGLPVWKYSISQYQRSSL